MSRLRVLKGGTGSDQSWMLNRQLASALTSMGDSQFWEENISPSTIRTSLATADPSSSSSTAAMLKGMKWLLASISKGRNVSDFYPHVVKLVDATSLEVRKLVYMYLVQYADHDATTRELSLLSINSFQRGMADAEQLIRALALRVLTSIRIQDVLQIQILGVQKCAKDPSPYVRKCAANALSKLSARCGEESQLEVLLEIMKSMLDEDTSTMVLSSCIIAFVELCPHKLELLHMSFRKICHLVTDMDEWGQVAVIETLTRYCRKFFREPHNLRKGSAEVIDRQRRVRRTVHGISSFDSNSVAEALDEVPKKETKKPEKPTPVQPKKVKRRIVKKGFYSDEEDESTDEEAYIDEATGKVLSTADAFKQRNILGGSGDSPVDATESEVDEDSDLQEDHRMLLRSTMPLLRSRNSAVVLAVCSLHYYCGVASIKVRSSIGRALVRIHRDRREIQYVVLTSIRTLVHECPSAFTPFLQDFFVTAMDSSFTRLIKLDILTALALEPAAIEAVLKELRSYIRYGDKAFACAAIQTVGKVTELARIVYDRHGKQIHDITGERKKANRIAMNCLSGLVTLSHASDNSSIVGACVECMRRILLQIMSYSEDLVEDPEKIRSVALRRILLLVLQALSSSNGASDDSKKDGKKKKTELEKLTIDLPQQALATGLWIVGEWVSSMAPMSSLKIQKVGEKSQAKIRVELARLIVRSFPDLTAAVKEQGIHFASKLLVSGAAGFPSLSAEVGLCETILSMGRVDMNTDVRDRARFESGLIHQSIGLKKDLDSMDLVNDSGRRLTLEEMKRIYLTSKPASSSLPLEEDDDHRAAFGESGGTFRFGTLSSLVGHTARKAYLPLPPWASQDSPSSLRDPPDSKGVGEKEPSIGGMPGAFYDDDDGGDDDGDDENDSDSDSDSDSSSEDDSSSGDDSDDEDDSSDDESPQNGSKIDPMSRYNTNGTSVVGAHPVPFSMVTSQASSSWSEDESDDDETDDENDKTAIGMGATNADVLRSSAATSHTDSTLIPMGEFGKKENMSSSVSSVSEDLKGLVLAPVVVDGNSSSSSIPDDEFSSWRELVRPQYSGGLYIQGRYLRGTSKTKCLESLGLPPKSNTTICLQVKLENKRSDHAVVRRIRLLQRSMTGTGSSSHVVPKKAIFPGEIGALNFGQSSDVTIAFDFNSASDRDDALVARFEVKSSVGSAYVELKPGLVESMQPCHMITTDFDRSFQKLQGFSRVSTSINASQPDTITPALICKFAALTPLSDANSTNDSQEIRLVGSLPASGSPIFVKVTKKVDGNLDIVVCSDEALAVNGVMNYLKKEISAANK